MSALVLDAGALVAVERNERRMWARLAAAAADSIPVVIPSTALAQVWRARASQALLSRAVAHCEIAAFDPLARAVGELCGRAGTSDVCDAHVAIVAAARGGALCTSDPDDMRTLLAALRSRTVTILRC